MGLNYVVLTSVDRDDLPDGGALHFARTIQKIREMHPGMMVEVLIPDFQNDVDAIRTIVGPVRTSSPTTSRRPSSSATASETPGRTTGSRSLC